MRDDEAATTITLEGRHKEPLSAESVRDSIDEVGEESFPASDPPANTPITRIGYPCHSE